MRESQPDVYSCDWCDTEKTSQTLMRWVGVERIGVYTWYADPLTEERHFCSMQHAALWLLNQATAHETLDTEALFAQCASIEASQKS